MRVFLAFILIISFISCDNDSHSSNLLVDDICVIEFRAAMSITSAEAYPVACLETFEMYEGDGGIYFLGCNSCAICESIPLYCDGGFLHNVISSQEDYFAYLDNSRFVKVVGFIE